MRYLSLIFSLVFINALAQNALAFDGTPKNITVDFHTLYVPEGFDSNDQFQFVGEGLFRHSCFRPGPTDVFVDRTAKKIFVQQRAYLYDGICVQAILPFDKTIEVGILPPGRYEIVQTDAKFVRSSILGSVQIATAQGNEPDDYLYAPISQAFYQQSASGRTISLTGEFPNSCMKLQEVRIEVSRNVIVVLPIAELRKDVNCTDGRFAFSHELKLGPIPNGRYLIHVRSMNAKAINTLVNIN